MNGRCIILKYLIFSISLFASNAYLQRRSHYHNLLTQYALKYDYSNFVNISIPRPFGLELEEIGKSKGVYVSALSDSAKAKTAGVLYPGLMLLSAGGVDLKNSDFDAVMDVLSNLPMDKNIDLVFVDMQSVSRGPAVLSIKTEAGQKIIAKCLKGQVLRDVLLGVGVEIYDVKGKLTNCGGGGSCGTCVVDVKAADWEPRPDFEAKRLKKYSETARLSCNTVVEGDAEIIIRPPKIL